VQNVICVANSAVEQPLVSGYAELFERTQICRSEVAAGTASSMQSARMTFKAYIVCAYEPITVPTCSDTLRQLVMMTPRILIVVDQ